MKLCNLRKSRALISNTAIAFSTFILKQLNKAFLAPSFQLFVLHETLNFDKFEGGNSKMTLVFSLEMPK